MSNIRTRLHKIEATQPSMRPLPVIVFGEDDADVAIARVRAERLGVTPEELANVTGQLPPVQVCRVLWGKA